jgi:hypothetical protein
MIKCEICGKKATVQYVHLEDKRIFYYCEGCCESMLRDKEALADKIIERTKKKFHCEIEVKGEVR